MGKIIPAKVKMPMPGNTTKLFEALYSSVSFDLEHELAKRRYEDQLSAKKQYDEEHKLCISKESSEKQSHYQEQIDFLDKLCEEYPSIQSSVKIIKAEIKKKCVSES